MTSILLHPIFNRVLSGFSQDVLGVFSGYSPLKQYAILNCMPIGGTLKKALLTIFKRFVFFRANGEGQQSYIVRTFFCFWVCFVFLPFLPMSSVISCGQPVGLGGQANRSLE